VLFVPWKKTSGTDDDVKFCRQLLRKVVGWAGVSKMWAVWSTKRPGQKQGAAHTRLVYKWVALVLAKAFLKMSSSQGETVRGKTTTNVCRLVICFFLNTLDLWIQELSGISQHGASTTVLKDGEAAAVLGKRKRDDDGSGIVESSDEVPLFGGMNRAT
jgi:hypothetical protein